MQYATITHLDWNRALLRRLLDLFTAYIPLNAPDSQFDKSFFDWDSCLRRVRNRDEDAAAELVDQLYSKIAAVVGKRSSGHTPVEDVVQEVFVRIFNKINQYRGDVPFEHWASRVAVSVSLNHLRGKRTKLELRRADLSDEEDATLDRLNTSDQGRDHTEQFAANDLLMKLLDRLSPDDRMAVELIELQGHTTEEAAQLVNIRPVAMRARISRARKRLRGHLQTLLAEKKNDE